MKTTNQLIRTFYTPAMIVLFALLFIVTACAPSGQTGTPDPNSAAVDPLPVTRENNGIIPPTYTPGPSTENSTTAAPTTNNSAFTPGDPTATPPGEEITDPNYLQGKEAYKAKNYEAVLQLMTLVIEENPDLPPAYWYRGMAYFYLEQYENGRVEMEQALALDPNYALGYADLALMLSSLGQTEEAFTNWQKALSLDPSLAKVHHNLGNMYTRQGDYTKALEELDLALAIDPKRASTWGSRGDVLSRLNRYAECIESTTQGINADPEYWLNYSIRGSCASNAGQYTEAIADFDIFLAEVQDDYQTWYNRGLTHRYLGNNQEALSDYSKALELNPEFPWAYINRGNIYIDLEEFELALADYTASLDYGASPAAYMGIGNANYGLKDYSAAETAYQQAFSLLPSFGDAYGRLSNVYLDQERYQEAIDTATTALSLQLTGSNEAIVLQIRGRAYFATGDYDNAVVDLERAHNLYPTLLGYYYRGTAYQAVGRTQDAIADLTFFVQNSDPKEGINTEEIEDAQARLAELEG